MLKPFTDFLWHTITANLVLLTLICVFIYRNVKDKAFLFYALYNTFLLFYVLPKNLEVIKIDFLNQDEFPSIRWGIQIVYNTFLTYFGIYFLRLKNHYPRLTRVVDFFLKTIVTIGVIGCVIFIVFDAQEYYFLLFTYGYLPLQLSVGLYFLYLATKVTTKERYYYFVGIFSYIVLSLIAFILTFIRPKNLGVFDPISFFYIGILVESICFIFGLGERVKDIYSQKMIAQQKLTTIQKQLNERLQEQLKQVEIEKKLTELEFTLMTSKMNSHFLFNTLNSIKLYVIENDIQNAVDYLGKFSEFVRKVLEISTVKIITLEEELYTSQLYIDIENIRFNNEIIFKVRVNEGIDLQTKIPPFILQPFLENAIWHGIATKKEKRVDLSIKVQNDKIYIEIQDNGIGRKKADEVRKLKSDYKKSLGLSIINEVLTNYYNDDYSLSFIDLYDKEEQPQGTKVILELPLQCNK